MKYQKGVSNITTIITICVAVVVCVFAFIEIRQRDHLLNEYTEDKPISTEPEVKYSPIPQVTTGEVSDGPFKGDNDSVSSVKELFAKIQHGNYSTKGTTTNTSIFYPPYPNPNQRLTGVTTVQYEGYFNDADYFYRLQIDNNQGEQTALKIQNADKKKYLTITYSTLVAGNTKEPLYTGSSETAMDYLNKTYYIPQEFLGSGKYAIGPLLDGWGISKNVMRTPDLLSPDEGFYTSGIPLFNVESSSYSLVHKKKYTLTLIRENLIPFAVMLREKEFNRKLTYAEKDLITNDYKRVKDITITIYQDTNTGNPISLKVLLTSEDKEDKVYRDLNYTFDASQTFEPPLKVQEPTPLKDTPIINPMMFSKIAG